MKEIVLCCYKRGREKVTAMTHHTISYQFNDIESPSILWGKLKETYGTPGLNRAFIEFKCAMGTVIPNGSDPGPALDKILTHFTCLREMKFEISTRIQAMIILSKCPPSMNPIVQLLTSVTNEALTDDKKIDLQHVLTSIRGSWETTSRTKGNNQQRANKLSAVRPANNQPPIFQQQQQQRGDWQQGRGGHGGTRRGKRGGRKNVQQQLQQATV